MVTLEGLPVLEPRALAPRRLEVLEQPARAHQLDRHAAARLIVRELAQRADARVLRGRELE